MGRRGLYTNPVEGRASRAGLFRGTPDPARTRRHCPEDINKRIQAKCGTLSVEDLEAFRQAWTIRHPTRPKGKVVGEALKEITHKRGFSGDAAADALREAAIGHSPQMVKLVEDGLVEYLHSRAPKH